MWLEFKFGYLPKKKFVSLVWISHLVQFFVVYRNLPDDKLKKWWFKTIGLVAENWSLTILKALI